MPKEIMSDKEEKFQRVYTECLKLIHEEGLKAVNHTAVANLAGVSRAWIYKYIGDGKDEMIRNAAKYFGAKFIQYDSAQVEITTTKDMLRSLWEGTSNNLTFTNEYPYIVSLYVRYAGTDNILGEIVDEFEHLYFERLKNKFLRLNKNEELAEEAAHLVKALRIGAALEFGKFSKTKMTAKEKKKTYEALNTILKKLLKEYI